MLTSSPWRERLPQAAHNFIRALPIGLTVVLFLSAALNTVGAGLEQLPAWIVGWLDLLSSFAAVFLGIFIEAVPFLLLGALASGIVEVFIDRAELARWMPRSPFLGALAGSLLGLFFPVCECGVVPFARRLILKGVPVSVAIATLLAAPVLNPIVIASTLAAFGTGTVFWGRIGLSLSIAVVTSLVFSLHTDPLSLLRPAESNPVQPPVLAEPVDKPAPAGRLRRALVIAVDEFFEMGRFLVLGALLAALMQTFIPQTALLGIGQGPVLSVLVMTGLAVILSVCSTIDAFIALAFTGAFSSGSILAFLVFGPMVDIKSALMFLRVFKPRTIAYLILLPLMLTLIATVFINYFGPGW